MIKGMHHLGIMVGNLDKSIDFYKNILGFDVVGERWTFEQGKTLGGRVGLPRRVAFVQTGNVLLELMDNLEKVKNMPEGVTGDMVGSKHFAFEIDDIESMVEELKQKGVSFEIEPVVLKEKQKVTFFKDPDGNTLELFQKI